MGTNNHPEDFIKPPFGILAIWGKRKVGKTIAALNSPWEPVHIIDVEFSAEDYEQQFPMVHKLGLLDHPFTRASCITYDDFLREVLRITGTKDKPSDVHYGTIILDTVGQITEWIKTVEFSVKDSDKIAQIVWGRVRDRLRNMLLQLLKHTDFVIMTAHEREYPTGTFSPRANPAILELASTSVRLVRQPNQKIPDGIVDVARLPVFPPKIPKFSIDKLLAYMEKPADWDDLPEEERVETPMLPLPEVSSEEEPPE